MIICISVLNNGGKLIIIDFDKNRNISHPRVHNGFSHKELEETLHAVGFISIQTNTFYHGEHIFMQQDVSMFLSSSKK